MQARLIAMGERMPEWVNTGVEEYRRRLAGGLRLEIEPVALPRQQGMPAGKLRQREAELLGKRLRKYPDSHTVALEVTGRRLSTESLADRVAGLRDEGTDLILLAGGPEGLCPEFSAGCREQWSLSDLTLPHPLVRILVAEQLYRAWSMLQGHPYHR